MLKMERLDSAEILHQETNMADDTKGKSFTDSLVTKVRAGAAARRWKCG